MDNLDIIFCLLTGLVMFIIPKVISFMIVSRSLSVCFENKQLFSSNTSKFSKVIKIFVFIFSLFLCFNYLYIFLLFMIVTLLSDGLYYGCFISSPLLLELCFFKYKTTYKKIFCFLFSALLLAVLVIMIISSIDKSDDFFYFVIHCFWVLVIGVMCLYVKINDGMLKNMMSNFILAALSTLSVIAAASIFLLGTRGI